MGSKSRIAKHIVPIIQDYIDSNGVKTYIEPFVGGANVIDKIKCDSRIGTDKNPYLVALLRRAQSGLELYDEVSKELYDKARAAYNDGGASDFEDWQLGNIGFLASYNGRWFDGGFAKTVYEKTKNGLRLRDYYQEAKSNLLKQSPNLSGITFECRDYTEHSPIGAVVYCDPPYKGTKQFANAVKFDYDLFWGTMRKWSNDNIVVVSEESAPDDFDCIWRSDVSRSIKASDHSKSTEKLFVYNNGNV